MYRLENPIQHYSWGSTTVLPEFLGISPDGRPHAELWMGTHALAPSRVRLSDGQTRRLDRVAGAGQLPYLLKVLTAERPLSLQVHPRRETARAGFEDEEARGVPLEARERAFTDPSHKPEMAIALTPFESLVGLRPTAELGEILLALGAPLTTGLAERLRADPGFAGIVRLLGVILSEDEPLSRQEIDQVVRACAEQVARGVDPGRAFSTVVEIARWHPYDPGVVAALLLDRVTLQPGEAVFLAHGIIHAHLSGTCLEVQASSNNVLRAGLTSKPLQREAVLACLEQGMSDTFRVEPKVMGDSRLFVPPAEEFAVAVTRRQDPAAAPSAVPAAGQRIAICTDGEVVAHAGSASLPMRRGDSVFLPAGDGELTLTGIGAIALAYTP